MAMQNIQLSENNWEKQVVVKTYLNYSKFTFRYETESNKFEESKINRFPNHHSTIKK